MMTSKHEDVDHAIVSQPLSDFESGDDLAIPVRWSDDGLFAVNPEKDRTIQIHGVPEKAIPEDITEKTYFVYCAFSKFIRGQNSPRDRIFIEEITAWEPCSQAKAEDQRTSDSNSQCGSDLATAEGSWESSSVGKQVTTDQHGERIAGRNPFADPKKIKDANLHQGG
jgi:hypothetical protein